MKGEITETVQSVYDKLVSPKVKEEGGSSTNGMMLIRKEAENNGSIIASASEMDSTFSDSEPKEPPGFSLFNGHQNNPHNEQHKQELQPPMSHERGLVEEQKDNNHCSQDVLEPEETDLRVLPGFSADKELKQPSDDTDEDPDLPPGFGWCNDMWWSFLWTITFSRDCTMIEGFSYKYCLSIPFFRTEFLVSERLFWVLHNWGQLLWILLVY